MHQTGQQIGCKDIDTKNVLWWSLIYASVMDHCIESPQRIRLIGNVFGCIDVGQIAYYDVLSTWHVLLCVPSAFSIARMEDNLMPLLG